MILHLIYVMYGNFFTVNRLAIRDGAKVLIWNGWITWKTQ